MSVIKQNTKENGEKMHVNVNYIVITKEKGDYDPPFLHEIIDPG